LNNRNSEHSVKPLVSVIVPVYNVKNYLQQCVDSLLNQTLENIEIILINDGSTDSCPVICDAYAEQYKRVRVIHQKNSGYGKVCNTGIASVRSEFFGIIESDDYVEHDMFERLYNLAKSNDLDAVRCHYYYYNSRANTRERVDLSHIPHNTIYPPQDVLPVFSQAPAVWSMLYRTNFVLENNIRFLETPGASYQDTSFTFKIFAMAKRFMLTDDTFVHYRIDNENSSSASKSKIFCVCDEFREIERFIKEKGLEEKLAPIVPKIKFPAYMWNYRRLPRKNRWIFLKTFAEEMRNHIRKKDFVKANFSRMDIIKMYIIAFFYPIFFRIDRIVL